MLIVSIVSAISWLIGTHFWIKQFEINLRQQHQLSKMSFAPDLVIENLKVFPVGFSWSQQRGRFRMTASVRDVDYLEQLVEMNQAQCTIHYSQAQLQKLEKTRPSLSRLSSQSLKRLKRFKRYFKVAS